MKREKNLLLMHPIRNCNVAWALNKDGFVQLKIIRKGLLFKFLKTILNLPEELTIDLDEIGYEVWELCDGKHTIFDISNRLSQKFGEKAEPLYPRLIKFLKMLKENNLIRIIEK